MIFNKKGIRKNILVSYTHTDSIISEQYRMIESNINFSVDHQHSRSFLITSPSSGEGKTTIIANLAVIMAQRSKKVLLIDANLRSPTLHSIFKVTNTIGLSDVLTKKITLSNAVNETGILGLDILTSGQLPTNYNKMFDSQVMKEIINNAYQTYNIILIDSHSILDLSETKLLASLCDGVILVIRKGKTLLEKVLESKKVLEFAKAKIIGVILND